MANPNGRKGASFERLIADYMRDQWVDPSAEFIDRRVKTGSKDKGDLSNVRLGKHRVAVELKNVKALNLAGWVQEAQEEARNDDAIAGIVIHKRVKFGKPADQYVTMTLDSLLTLLSAAITSGD